MAVWINEFHYDDDGADTGEFVEVILSGTENLADYSVVLYNGANGQSYDTDLLSTGVVTDLGNGYRSVVISYNGTLQNGSPDGVALIGPGGAVVEFLSYEGVFTAANGPASGVTSTNVGVSEPGNADGTSVARVGEGGKAADFTWSVVSDDTPGGANVGQVLKTVANVPVVSVQASDSQGVETVDTGIGFTFTRTGDLSQSLTVAYTVGGSATAGADYAPGLPGTVTFAAGSATAVVNLEVLDDAAIESRETVQVTLQDGAAYDLGAPSAATAGIVSDDGVELKIHDVQGSGAATTRSGQTVVLEAIVTGDFQNGDADATRNLNGFFIQEETGDWDANSATSEGLFVFGTAPNVNVGDKVRVVGTVSEFSGQTQVTAIKVEVVQAGAVADVESLAVDIAVPGDLEAYEGMVVRVPQTLVVHDLGDLERLGETRLYAPEGDGLGGAIDEAADGRPYTFTQTNDPSVSGFAAHEAAVLSRTLIYDDGLNGTWQGLQNYSTATAPQAGDTISGLTGVLDFNFGAFRVRAVDDVGNQYTDTHVREEQPPEVGGDITVASFNVLNFFVTLDNGGKMDNGQTPRGANTEAEFARQAAKLIDTLITLDADVLSLLEIENDFSKPSDPAFLTGGFASRAEFYRAEGNAIGYLVEKLNEALGDDVYDWVDPGVNHVGTDAISVAFIYKKDVVQIAEGTTVAIDANPINSRPTVAVTFEEVVGGGTFTAVGNHFKSKSSGDGANADQLDGQSRSNLDRVAQANRLDAWLDSNPTGTADADYVLLGDFNAYYREDPIDVLRAAGFQPTFEGESSSYVYDGQIGTLDYAFVNGSMAGQVTGSEHWHIGADEAEALDYNLDGGVATYVRPAAWFDAASPWRASDHDVTLIGLDLDRPPTAPDAEADAYAGVEDVALVVSAKDGVLANDTDLNDDDLTAVLVQGPATGKLTLAADGSFTYVPAADQTGPVTFTYQAKDEGGLLSETRTVTLTFAAVNDAPVAKADTAAVLEDQSVTIDVLANDTDVDAGDTRTLVSASATAYGASVAIVDGKLVYTADADAFDQLAAGAKATDTFTYTVKDAAGLTSTATVTVTVSERGDNVALNGGNGNETLSGSDKDETSNAGNGNDSVFGGAGADFLNGDNGNDTVAGGEGRDTVMGENGNDLLAGGEGDDRLVGHNGNDTLVGDAGADTLLGDNGDDSLLGGAGDDSLTGDTGNDLLNGGDGADRLYGGLGNDKLTGGAGEDVFVYAKSEGNDVILDFEIGVDSLQFAEGTTVRGVELRHVDNDGVLDAVLTFGGGSLTIMGAGSADWIGA